MSHPPAILCIDDNVLGLAVRKAMLESRDFRVFIAEDGARGLEVVKREPIDVVILDYEMPGMSGGTVARELRSKYPSIPILLLSGFLGSVPDWLLKTVDAYVVKGTPPELLMNELDRLLSATTPNPDSQVFRVSSKRHRHSRSGIAISKRFVRRCR